jgi:hypothetical protein
MFNDKIKEIIRERVGMINTKFKLDEADIFVGEAKSVIVEHSGDKSECETENSECFV